MKPKCVICKQPIEGEPKLIIKGGVGRPACAACYKKAKKAE